LKEQIMNRKTVSDPDLAALGEFQGTIDRNSNFRQQAFDHNLGRNVRVAKLLAYVGMLHQKGVAMAGTVECAAATRQNFSSSKSMTHMGLPTVPNQAAHFLPGQILVGRKEIWRFATSPMTRGHMEFLCAEVEHLPVAFNQAGLGTPDLNSDPPETGSTGAFLTRFESTSAAWDFSVVLK
jgi:hypothetical protein